MPVRKILLIGNPVLKQKSKPINKLTKQDLKLIDDMLETMIAYEGIGLSAPQVGVLKRIIVARWEGETFALINPTLKWKSEEKVTGLEGCLSIPDVQGRVNRFLKVQVNAIDAKGQQVTLEAGNWLARIFQHEIDHLNGMLITDRTNELYWTVSQKDEEGKEVINLIPTTKKEIITAFRRRQSIAYPSPSLSSLKETKV